MTIIDRISIGNQNFEYKSINSSNYLFNDFSIFCNLNIKIELVKYDNQKQFYDISYTWRYSKNLSEDLSENPAFKLHPLYYDKQFINNHNDGEIIYKNTLSDKLVEYLLLPLDELSKYSGSVSEHEYQKSLFKMVSNLWD